MYTLLCNTSNIGQCNVVILYLTLHRADVMKRCLTAPYWKVRFRDTFAGDVLTSFTRVIQDSIYSGVWIVTGAFMNVRDGMICML